MADKYGAKISYAVMPEVVKHFPPSIDHEIGLHIHPGWQEFISDKVKYQVGDSYLREYCNYSSRSTVLRDYSFDEQKDMIKKGKEWIEQNLGAKTSFFVAGRWSINNDTIKALIDLGFKHDCSATPSSKPCHHDWSKLPRICSPYHPSEGDYQLKGDLDLLIIPISQMIVGGNVNPEASPFFGFKWLKACFLEYYRCGVPLFHICLHSPCMADPFFANIMDKFLEFIARYDVTFKFVSDICTYNKIYKTRNIVPYVFGLNKYLIKDINNEILRRSKNIFVSRDY